MDGKQARINHGKKFENAFSNSVPEGIKLYRLPDSAQSFGRSKGLRFSRKNPFDFIMWDRFHKNLYGLELKTVQEKSISFERTTEDSGNIHYHQIQGLLDWKNYGVICGFVIEFRALETTIFLEIGNFIQLINQLNKKSFSFADLEKYNIEHIVIPQERMRTRYKYDIGLFIDKTVKYGEVSDTSETLEDCIL